MALSLVLIGVVFMLSYTGGLAGTIIVNSGGKTIKCRVGADGLDDMVELVERLTQLKMGVSPRDGHAKSASDGLDYGDRRATEPAHPVAKGG